MHAIVEVRRDAGTTLDQSARPRRRRPDVANAVLTADPDSTGEGRQWALNCPIGSTTGHSHHRPFSYGSDGCRTAAKYSNGPLLLSHWAVLCSVLDKELTSSIEPETMLGCGGEPTRDALGGLFSRFPDLLGDVGWNRHREPFVCRHDQDNIKMLLPDQ